MINLEHLLHDATDRCGIRAQGAVLFASVIPCLSWNGIADMHLSTRALFHSSIVLALVSVISGAQ